jgi:3-methylcrotonyl-CoA carboxylase alpha subunit
VAINALERARQEAAPTGGAEILNAPMPGVVVRVAVDVGAEVSRGQLLMTIESMKLETAITAPHDARIAEICVSAGESFDQDAALIRLEAETNDEPDAPAKENAK